MHSLAQFIMRGRLQAMFVALATAALSLLLPPVNCLSGATVSLVTLRRGPREGLLVIVGAGAIMALFAVLSPLNPMQTSLFAGAIWLPVWGLAAVLRYTVSLSMTLITAAAIGVAVVVVTYLLIENPAQWWTETLQHQMETVGGENLSTTETFRTILTNIAPHMTGILVAALVLGLMMSILLARWWQALLYNPGGFRLEFHALRLGRAYAMITLAVLLISSVFSNRLAELCANIMMVFMATYVLHGLGLVHSFATTKGIHTGWLAAMYLSMMVLPQLALLLAALAFADSWSDFRGRIKRTEG